MRFLPLAAFLAAFLLTACAPGPRSHGTAEPLYEVGESLEQLADRVKPAIVRIQVVEPAHRQGREERFVASGSGAIITADGFVITNHHVAGKAVLIKCTMANREEVPARLVGADPATDIAVIQLMPETPTTYPSLEFADSDAVRVGDPVVALGSPLGVSQSVTQGIVSNTALVIGSVAASSFLNLDGESVGELVRWISHDATIFPGNSGGPLLDLNGNIIGINEISYGLAGSIPGNLARDVALSIIADGTVERAYIGAQFQPRMKSQGAARGVLVASVLPGSPAEKAGLQPGDLVLSLGEAEVDARFLEDLPLVNQTVANLRVGREIVVSYARDGLSGTARLTPEPREPARPPTVELPAWGMTARDLTLWSRLDLGQPGAEGVLVTSTRPGGPADAAKPSIRAGDLITSVEGAATPRLADLRAASRAAEEAREGTRTPLLVGFTRDSQALLTVVNAGIDSLEDPGREAQKGWLPIETQVLTPDVAARLGLEGARGVRVTRVYDAVAPEGFPLQPGDILTHLDGEAIPAFEPHHTEIFDTMVRQYRIGGKAELTVLRGGEAMKVETVLGPSPRRLREMARWRDLRFDFILREATFTERQQADWGGFVPEVVVESVGSGGWASLGGLEAGEAIIAIQGRPVSSLDDARAAMEAVHRDKPAVVIVETRVGVQNFFVEMEASWGM